MIILYSAIVLSFFTPAVFSVVVFVHLSSENSDGFIFPFLLRCLFFSFFSLVAAAYSFSSKALAIDFLLCSVKN